MSTFDLVTMSAGGAVRTGEAVYVVAFLRTLQGRQVYVAGKVNLTVTGEGLAWLTLAVLWVPCGPALWSSLGPNAASAALLAKAPAALICRGQPFPLRFPAIP